MQTPAFLKKGDTIGIAAPARSVSPDEIAPAIRLFEKWGLKVICAANIYQKHHQFAGTEAERLAGLQSLLDNNEVKAIICVRGGYGSVRIIDSLSFDKFVQKPKWIVGFSDITVLLMHIENCYRIETLHAPMAFGFDENEPENVASMETLRKALFGENLYYRAKTGSLSRKGIAQGAVTGGNLSILYSLSMSVSDSITAGKILFIEDVDEYLYHVDRMMQQLKRSGKLSDLAGLVVGGMTGMRDNQIPFGKTAGEIIAEAVQHYDYPVLFDFPAGHQKLNQSLIIGRMATLEVGEEAELRFHEPNRASLKSLFRRGILKSVAYVFLLFAAIYSLYYFVINLLK